MVYRDFHCFTLLAKLWSKLNFVLIITLLGHKLTKIGSKFVEANGFNIAFDKAHSNQQVIQRYLYLIFILWVSKWIIFIILFQLLRTHMNEQRLSQLVNQTNFCGETPMDTLEAMSEDALSEEQRARICLTLMTCGADVSGKQNWCWRSTKRKPMILEWFWPIPD